MVLYMYKHKLSSVFQGMSLQAVLQGVQLSLQGHSARDALQGTFLQAVLALHGVPRALDGTMRPIRGSFEQRSIYSKGCSIQDLFDRRLR